MSRSIQFWPFEQVNSLSQRKMDILLTGVALENETGRFIMACFVLLFSLRRKTELKVALLKWPTFLSMCLWILKISNPSFLYCKSLGALVLVSFSNEPRKDVD